MKPTRDCGLDARPSGFGQPLHARSALALAPPAGPIIVLRGVESRGAAPEDERFPPRGAPATSADSFQLEPCPNSDRPAAWELLLGRLDPPARAAQVATLECQAETNGPVRLWVARQGGRIVAAAGAQLQPGRVAYFWAPESVPEAPPAARAGLVAALVAEVGRATPRPVLAQALTEVDDEHASAPFVAAGFRPLAELVYLLALAEQAPSPSPEADDTPAGVELVPAAELAGLDWPRLIAATYEGTLDCPALNEVRNPADVLAGYRAVGERAGELWFIARDAGRPCGCLLLADHAAESLLELVYVGLAPRARGRGLGNWLAREALRVTRQWGRRQLVVAVDGANRPAVAMYLGAGFVEFARRQVWWLPWAEAASS